MRQHRHASDEHAFDNVSILSFVRRVSTVSAASGDRPASKLVAHISFPKVGPIRVGEPAVAAATSPFDGPLHAGAPASAPRRVPISRGWSVLARRKSAGSARPFSGAAAPLRSLGAVVKSEGGGLRRLCPSPRRSRRSGPGARALPALKSAAPLFSL